MGNALPSGWIPLLLLELQPRDQQPTRKRYTSVHQLPLWPTVGAPPGDKCPAGARAAFEMLAGAASRKRRLHVCFPFGGSG